MTWIPIMNLGRYMNRLAGNHVGRVYRYVLWSKRYRPRSYSRARYARTNHTRSTSRLGEGGADPIVWRHYAVRALGVAGVLGLNSGRWRTSHFCDQRRCDLRSYLLHQGHKHLLIRRGRRVSGALGRRGVRCACNLHSGLRRRLPRRSVVGDNA